MKNNEAYNAKTAKKDLGVTPLSGVDIAEIRKNLDDEFEEVFPEEIVKTLLTSGVLLNLPGILMELSPGIRLEAMVYITELHNKRKLTQKEDAASTALNKLEELIGKKHVNSIKTMAFLYGSKAITEMVVHTFSLGEDDVDLLVEILEQI